MTEPVVHQTLRKTYGDSDALLLLHCQAALKAGQPEAVATILAQRLSVLHSPALVGYRVANEATPDKAQQVLTTAIAYWRENNTVGQTITDSRDKAVTTLTL